MYRGTGNSLALRGPGLAGVFGCDVDRDDFDSVNRVTIYPGKINVWMLARHVGEGSSIQDFIEENIVEPLDTSWTSDNVVVGEIKKIPNDPQKVRLNLVAWGRRPSSKTASTLTPKPEINSNREFYMVSFIPPKDAPRSLPWPLEGCVEEADWVLGSFLTDVKIATAEPVPPVSTAAADQPVTAADAERIQEQTLDRLRAGRELGVDDGFPIKTTLLVGAVLAGGAYLYWRVRVAPQ